MCLVGRHSDLLISAPNCRFESNIYGRITSMHLTLRPPPPAKHYEYDSMCNVMMISFAHAETFHQKCVPWLPEKNICSKLCRVSLSTGANCVWTLGYRARLALINWDSVAIIKVHAPPPPPDSPNSSGNHPRVPHTRHYSALISVA